MYKGTRSPGSKMNDAHHIIVKFGPGINSDMQGRAMLHLEKWLREQGLPVEVFKETKADDSKLRSLMTVEQRAKL